MQIFIHSIIGRKIIEKGKEIVKEKRLSGIRDAVLHMENMVEEAGCSAAVLGSTVNMLRRMNDARFKALGRQNLGDTLHDLVIPQHLQVASNGEKFLIYDNNQGANRMLVFATADALDVSTY